MPQALCVLICCFAQADPDDVVGLWKSDGDTLLRVQREGAELVGSLDVSKDETITIRGRIEADRLLFDYTRPIKDGEKQESGSGFLSLGTRMIGGFGPFKNAHKIPDIAARGDWAYLEFDRCLSREDLTQRIEAKVNEELDHLNEIVELTEGERAAAKQSVHANVQKKVDSLFGDHAVGVWKIPPEIRTALRENYGDVLGPEHLATYRADQKLRNQILHRAFVVVTLSGLDMGLALDESQYEKMHDWLSSDEMKTFRVKKKASGLLMRSGLPEQSLKGILTATQLTEYANRQTTFRTEIREWPKREEADVVAGLQENIDRAFELRIESWQREYTIGEAERDRLRVLRRRVGKRLVEQRVFANQQIQSAQDRGRWSQDSAFVLIPLLPAGVLISSDAVWRRFSPGIIDRQERQRYQADLQERMEREHEAEILQLAVRIDEGGQHELSGRQLQQLVELFRKSIQPDPLRKLSHLDADLMIAGIPREKYVDIIGESRWKNRRFWIQNTVAVAKLLNYEGGLQVNFDSGSDE